MMPPDRSFHVGRCPHPVRPYGAPREIGGSWWWTAEVMILALMVGRLRGSLTRRMRFGDLDRPSCHLFDDANRQSRTHAAAFGSASSDRTDGGGRTWSRPRGAEREPVNAILPKGGSAAALARVVVRGPGSPLCAPVASTRQRASRHATVPPSGGSPRICRRCQSAKNSRRQASRRCALSGLSNTRRTVSGRQKDATPGSRATRSPRRWPSRAIHSPTGTVKPSFLPNGRLAGLWSAEPAAEQVFALAAPELQPVLKREAEVDDRAVEQRRAAFEPEMHEAAVERDQQPNAAASRRNRAPGAR